MTNLLNEIRYHAGETTNRHRLQQQLVFKPRNYCNRPIYASVIILIRYDDDALGHDAALSILFQFCLYRSTNNKSKLTPLRNTANTAHFPIVGLQHN